MKRIRLILLLAVLGSAVLPRHGSAQSPDPGSQPTQFTPVPNPAGRSIENWLLGGFGLALATALLTLLKQVLDMRQVSNQFKSLLQDESTIRTIKALGKFISKEDQDSWFRDSLMKSRSDVVDALWLEWGKEEIREKFTGMFRDPIAKLPDVPATEKAEIVKDLFSKVRQMDGGKDRFGKKKKAKRAKTKNHKSTRKESSDAA
jgi:hypothetical protein